jgi:hypothetical protein
MSEFEAKARAIQLSYPSPPEKWFAENPGSAAEFVAIMEKAQEQNYAAIASALAEAEMREREACAKIVSDTANSQRDLAKGNYSHEHHAAYMLDGAASSIRSRTQKETPDV